MPIRPIAACARRLAGSRGIRSAGSRTWRRCSISALGRLHRHFTAAVGYGPKTLQRVLRLQRVLAQAGRQPLVGRLADIALDAGYADQAHMSREVRALTGRNPRALLDGAQSTLDLSDLFKTDTGPLL
jgi:AraC-like DNA-binding protein